MIEFDFEVRLLVRMTAATATTAYKKLLEQLPTTGVSQLEMKVISSAEEAPPEKKGRARKSATANSQSETPAT
jgi:hypothetical protein